MTCGSGRRATCIPIPGSRHCRCRSTRRCSSARSTRCCAAVRSPWTRWPAGGRSATGTIRSGGRSSPDSARPATGTPDVPSPGLPGTAGAARRLLVEPPHSLFRQSWAPRRSRGTGRSTPMASEWVGTPRGDPEPARYRRPGRSRRPEFADLARVVRSTALLGAVRDATVAGADGEAAAAPFAADRWLFSHNGMGLAGLPRPAGDQPAPAELLSLEALTPRSSGRCSCTGCAPVTARARRWPTPFWRSPRRPPGPG